MAVKINNTILESVHEILRTILIKLYFFISFKIEALKILCHWISNPENYQYFTILLMF